MKKFLIFLVSIVVVVCIGLTTFYFLKNDEVISIETKELYVNAGNSIPLEALGINIKKDSKKTTFDYNAGGEEVTNLISYKAEENAYVVNSDAGGQVTLVITTSNEKYSKFEVVVHIGSGTAENPFYIFEETDLNNIGTIYSETSYFALMNDITLTEEFKGICSGISTGFAGNFNGNGHTIKKLNLANHNKEVVASKAGLFNSIASGAVVSNLIVEDANIYGYFANAGILAGQNFGTIEKVIVRNSNITNLANGGKSGILAGSIVSADKVQMNAVENSTIFIGVEGVAVSNATVGGFAGVVDQSTIQACYVNNITITNTNSGMIAGGFAGEFIISPTKGSIQQSYAYVAGPGANYAAFINTITSSDGIYKEVGMLQHLVGNFAVVRGATSAADILDSSLVATYDKEYFKNVANPENKVFFDKASSQYMVRGFASVAEVVETNEYVFYAMSENEKEFWNSENVWIISNAALPSLKMGTVAPENPNSKYYSKDIQSVSIGNEKSFAEIFSGQDVDGKKYFLDSNITIDSWEMGALINSEINGNGKTITINYNKSKAILDNETEVSVVALFSTIKNSTIENLEIIINSTNVDAHTFAGLAYSVEGVELVSSLIKNVNITFANEVNKKYVDFAGIVANVKAGATISDCSISGLNIASEAVQNAGAIALTNAGTIQNVKVNNSTLRAKGNIAGVVVNNTANVLNVETKELNISSDATVNAEIAAIASNNSGTIEKAVANAKILINSASKAENTLKVAGIAATNSSTIKDVVTSGEGIILNEGIQSKIEIGGIVSSNSGNIELANVNMVKLGNTFTGKDVRTGGVATTNSGSIKDIIIQSDIAGNWVAGIVVEMTSAPSSVVEEVAIGKVQKIEEEIELTKNTIYGDKYVAGVIVNFKQGVIKNVQANSDIQGAINATNSSLIALVFDVNATLKNATINSSITGNGKKYRETWTDFAYNDNISTHGSVFDYDSKNGMTYFNIAMTADHGIMQSVVVNLDGQGVEGATRGQTTRHWALTNIFTQGGFYEYRYDKDSSSSCHVKYTKSFRNGDTYSGYFNYEYYEGETTSKALEFGIGTASNPNTWSYNNGRGIILTFVLDYFA